MVVVPLRRGKRHSHELGSGLSGLVHLLSQLLQTEAVRQAHGQAQKTPLPAPRSSHRLVDLGNLQGLLDST